MLDSIKEIFKESIETKIAALEILPDPTAKASNMIIEALIAGNKIMTCGSDGSSALAQMFTAKLVNKYDRERPPGGEGGEIAALIGENDVEIRVPSNNHARIEEVHLLVINSLCETIDNTLFPSINL